VKRLARAEELHLWYRIRRGDDSARDKLVHAHLLIVVAVAKLYTDRGLPLLDLIAEGNIGLLRAVEGFDESLGTRFSTYATFWVRHTILRSLENQSRLVRIPSGQIAFLHRINTARQSLRENLGHDPTTNEIARKLDLPPCRVRDIQQVARMPLSLDAPTSDTVNAPLAETIQDPSSPNPGDSANDHDAEELLHRMLSTLPESAREVLELHFGLRDGVPRTLEEIGKRRGVTKEAVRLMERKALRRLRHPARLRELSS